MTPFAVLAIFLLAGRGSAACPHPRGYRLDLHVGPELSSYRGNVRIDLLNTAGKEEVDTLKLNADESLVISEADIKLLKLANDDLSDEESQEDEVLKISKVTRNGGQIELTCEEPLENDATYQLDMGFAGDLSSDSSKVFFKDSYQEQSTAETRWFVLLSANSKSLHQVFPCFDQPSLKSWFELTVVHKDTFNALSNTPVMERSNMPDDTGMVKSQFARTPLMSISSLGLFLSDFVMPQVEYVVNDGVKIGVWGRPDLAPALSKAQQVLPSLLVSLELYLSRPYPLQHLNLVALPGYTGDRPKNSWGLQWFKESELMNGNSFWLTQRMGKAAAMQWLGHLASPLNDTLATSGLATYLASLVAEQLEPSVYSWSTSSLHTMALELGKSRNLGLDQDQIYYLMETKVALLMRMFDLVFGRQTFKQAVQNFLAKKEFKAYTETELWQIITEQAWVDKKLPTWLTLGEVVKHWKKGRLPLLTFTIDYKNKVSTFSQEEFIDNLDWSPKVVKKGGVENRSGWWIPLIVREGGGSSAVNKTFWISPEQHSLTVKNISTTADYVLLNPASLGPFLVNYDSEGWKRLGDAVGTLSAETRAQLVHDSLTLALSGHLSAVAALQMTLGLRSEQSPQVWRAFFPLADRLRNRLQGSLAQKLLDTYIQRLLERVGASLGDEDRVVWKTEMRTKVNHLLCETGHPPCLQAAAKAFRVWLNATNPDEAIPISNNNLCPVVSWGNDVEWNFIVQRLCNFPKNRSRSERNFLLKTVAGCPRNETRYQILLNYTFSNEKHAHIFSDEDRFIILTAISGQTVGSSALFKFLKKNWTTMKSRVQGNLWEFLIQTAMGSFRTEEGLKQARELLEEKRGELGPGDLKAAQDSLQRVESRVRWSRENSAAAVTWLEATLAQPWPAQ